MTEQPEADVVDDVVSRIVRAAVRLINRTGVDGTTLPAICRESGVDEATLRTRFGSANDVFIEIARFMMAAYGVAIVSTMARRRSLYESIRLAQHSFLEVVQEHRETQSALMAIRIAATVDPRIGVRPGAAASLHEELITNAELWLEETGRVHDVTWELPPRLLASFVSASLTGVVVDYLARPDIDASRTMVDLIAFDLSRRGRRRAKNQIQ